MKPMQDINLEEPPKMTPKMQSNKRSMTSRTVLTVAIGLVLMLAFAAGAYFWRDNTANSVKKQQDTDIANYQRTIADLESKLAIEIAKNNGTSITPTEPVCTPIQPNSDVIDNIKASITSGDTAALEGYMASSVNVILAASEAYGVQTPTQAIADISSFISEDLNSWDYDFSLSTTTVNSYSLGDYGQYFLATSLVGKASNDQVISFSFDCDGNISTVFLASDEALL